jgi:solute:Na+ symporter, SSS family
VDVENGSMPEFSLAGLDIAVIIAYIFVILGIGFWVGRKKKESEGFFLGERGSVWPLIGFSLMAANLSGTSYLGLSGAGYHDGIAVWNYEWMATLVLVFFALFILPFYLHSKVKTMPEFLEQRYDRRSRYAFSGLTIFTAMFIDSAGALYAGAITARLLFPDLPLMVLVAGIAIIAGIYVIAGGLRAVMITDTLDGVLLLIAGGAIFVMGMMRLGSWEALQQVSPDNLTIIRPADDDFLPWPGIFTGVLWLGFYYWTTNHVVVQKALSAKSLDHGRWGALLAGFMQLPFLFLLIMPGTIGRAIFPDLPEPDQVWPALVFELFPIGVRGLIFAALIAALMSTLDSVLNGAASLVVNDFIRTTDRWDFDEGRLLLISRIAIGIFVVIAALWAPVIFTFEGIVEYFQAFLGHLTMPVVVLFLGGLFWPRGNRHAAFWTLVIGAPLGLALFLAGEIFELFDIQFLYMAGIMFLLSLILYVAISLMTEAPDPEQSKELTWSRRHWQKESEDLVGKPWWQNYRYQALALVIITIIMIWIFI